MSNPIYEIYVMEKPWYMDNQGFPACGTRERVGFYYELETAIQAVEENWCDMQDYYAHAAEILTIEPGLYPLSKRNNYRYFIWNQEKGKFETAELPEEVGRFI